MNARHPHQRCTRHVERLAILALAIMLASGLWQAYGGRWFAGAGS
ncbi:MAG TPA: hypothetical protein VFS13_05335 [Steroidobacteraceae bacterium]|jgi:hypothetical protein|nr:hypothetical protein [Steroidobacteraceae bacterium]